MNLHSKQNRNRGSRRMSLGGCLALAVGLLLASFSHAQETGRALLLKETDRVMTGNIVRRGDLFEVEIASQSRVSIPASQVAHLAADIEGLYQFKRQTVSQWSVGDHFQLARWCLLNDLLDHALEHYGEVTKRASGHPRVNQLAMEIERRLLREAEFRSYLGLGPQASDAGEGLARKAAQTAATTSPAAAPPVTTASSQAFQPAQHPEIARRFADRVQPILMNRCSQAACHGVQSSNRLRLLEPYAKSYARLTSENLASVLGQVASRPSELSPLVRYATRPHGIQRAPAIALTETVLLNELQGWIAFAQNPVVAAVASGPESGPQGVQLAVPRQFVPFQPAVSLVPVQPGASGLRQVPREEGQMTPSATHPSLPTTVESDTLEAQLQQMLAEEKATPGPLPSVPPSSADPFDPAEFNRKLQPNRGGR